ncbi:hypothetical protein [Methylobacterium indicum]|nr:hypothetical protein [Methylobacterium indicum]
MALRSTRYADELVSAGDEGGRIERIHIHKLGTVEIRFSWWKNGHFQPRPLDVTEDELLPLIQEAIEKGVFSDNFLIALSSILKKNNF